MTHACPEDGTPLVVLRRFVLESTDGPIEHVSGRCQRSHPFACSVEYLESLEVVRT